MTKRIQTPDGPVDFPDDMSTQDIERVLQRQYPPPASTQTGDRNSGLTVSDLVRGRQQLPRRGQSAPALQEANGFLATATRAVPFAGDINDAVEGAGEAFSPLFGVFLGAKGSSLSRVRDAYNRGAQRSRGWRNTDAADFYARRPVVSTATTVGAGLAPILMTAGAAAPEVAAANSARGLPLLAEQTARGAALGGVYGAGYGATTGDAQGASLEERARLAYDGAKLGAAFGGAAPTVINTVRPVARWAAERVGPLLDRLPRIAPQAEAGAGAFGTQIFAGGARSRPPVVASPSAPVVPPEAAGMLGRLADRAGLTADDVEARLSTSRANPQGEVLADIFNDPGVRTTRAIAQGPGRTGQLAAEVVRERAATQPERILNELHSRLKVKESPEEALAALSRDYEAASANLYEPLFARDVTPQARAAINEILQPYARTPAMRDAMARATRIFETDRANGVVQGQLGDNFARYMHYLKMGLDDAARFSSMPQSGIMATELRGIRTMQRRVLNAIDEHIPGYREARNRWSTIANAEEALSDGAGFLGENASYLQSRMAEMTDFERHHARIGFANAVAQRIGMRGSVNGNRNVAEALGSPEMQRRVAAMFDTPEQAAGFLDTLNVQNQLMRNASQWGSGSQTFSNVAHGADEHMQALGEMAGHAATGNVGGAMRSGWNLVRNAATLGHLERTNNVKGAALLRRVDQTDSEAFANEVVRILRDAERTAAQNTAAARTSARAGGAAIGGRRRQ